MSITLAIEPPQAAVTLCRHCGSDCGSEPVRAGRDVFCCHGCASVFAILNTHGLSHYYECEATPGVSQRAAEPRPLDRFAAFDDPAVAASVRLFDDGQIAGAVFAVPDLHCGACVWLLERLWRVDEGVMRAEADLVRRTVQVWYRPERLSLREVAERLASIGYEPVIDTPADPSQAQPAARAAAKSRRTLYLQIGVAGFAFGNAMIFSIPRYAQGGAIEPFLQTFFNALNLALAVPVLVYSASGYFTAAWRAIAARTMTLDVPVALGLAVLFARSVADIVTGRDAGFVDSFTGLVFVLLLGKLFQQKSIDRLSFERTFRSFLPLSVQVEGPHGPRPTAVDRIVPGDRLVLRAHEVVPVDAQLLDQDGCIDYAFVTGESTPVALRHGATVQAGGRVVGNRLHLLACSRASDSRLATLWTNPAFSTTKASAFASLSTRFSIGFTVIAVGLACVGAWVWWPDADMAVQVFTAVLIIACPCALTLAAPIALGTAMEMLSRHGLYLRRPSVALELAQVDAIAFDKTGTLTMTRAGVAVVHQGLTADEWRVARRLAAESVHPVSRAIAGASATGGADAGTGTGTGAGDTPIAGIVSSFRETAGQGIRGRVDGHDVAIGTAEFVSRQVGRIVPAGDTTIVAIDGRACGRVWIGGVPREGMAEAVGTLRLSHSIHLLSGDHAAEAERWRPVFGERMSFRQSPEQKLAFITTQRAAGRRVLMIGDGLNDAGAFAAADVGLAVCEASACIVPACDALIDGSHLRELPSLLRYASRVTPVIAACFIVSLLFNAIGLTLALTGALTPLAAAILMPVSSLTIIALSAGGMRWYARGLGEELRVSAEARGA
jgi:P-type Cu+ transporter